MAADLTRPSPGMCYLRRARLAWAFGALAIAIATAALAAEAGYQLSSGDALVVQVFGEPDFSGKYAVGPSGTITLPLIGTMQVAGQTLDATRDALTKALREVVKRPHVTVGLDELASERKVYAAGYVNKPGPLALPFGATVADAVAAAGPTEVADLRRVRLTHPGGDPITIDMSGFRVGAVLNIKEAVKYGDVLYVPKLEDQITVLGQVQKPGSVTLPPDQDLRVVDVLGRVGGGLTATADRTEATLLRPGEKPLVIDLKRLLLDGDAAQNVVMKAGDTLVIREAGKVSVLGEVAQPRSFEAPQPLNILESLAMAGGPKGTAGLEKSRILRADGTEQQIDLRAFLREGKIDKELALRAGDTLFIPEADPETVLFVGAVKQPGSFSIRETKQKDALRLVTAAGTLPTADLSRISVLRADKRLPLDLYKMTHDGDLSGNMDLEVGDVVLVPELDRMYVLGSVARQGELAVEPGMKIIDALARSGGFVPGSDPNAAVLVRSRPDGTSEFIKVRLADLQRGVAPEPTKLQPGDILYVPQSSGRHFGWDTIRDALWFVGGILALRR